MNYLYLLSTIINPNDVNVPKGDLNDGGFKLVLQIVFGVAGGIALLIVALGALKYTLSQGNAQEITKAKDTIIYAIVGLIVCIMAFSLVSFVLGKV